jgi:hypothetical protein
LKLLGAGFFTADGAARPFGGNQTTADGADDADGFLTPRREGTQRRKANKNEHFGAL